MFIFYVCALKLFQRNEPIWTALLSTAAIFISGSRGHHTVKLVLNFEPFPVLLASQCLLVNMKFKKGILKLKDYISFCHYKLTRKENLLKGSLTVFSKVTYAGHL